ARLVMASPHVMLTNNGAYNLAVGSGLPLLPPPDRHLIEKTRRRLEKQKKFMRLYERYFSTVGAVALDVNGDVAAGASTGGVSNMLPGRVGDTPIIGAGTYADNSLGAVSCTGMGEYIIRLSLAKEICMNLSTLTPLRAVQSSLTRLLRLGGTAGLIVLNSKGRFALLHTTPYMAAGSASNKGVFVRDAFHTSSNATRAIPSLF
ncbi:MAG TPA: isoaspartyl peptidase/L-asparaginase, partial [Thermodesulfovibrionales bacterium]|nr:isoaspartyl peptidase/L-asparaginase [Thermodesulfovibrionales bacterium]